MSLPPGFLDELRTRTSLAQVVGRKVMWDQRKSNQGKGDMWAPCPFHQEKTASFHVDDGQGFYYCFGCHAKGDAISFVRETENVSFIEAIEILAREAGMQMPARDPKAQEKADRRTQLAQVMEQAVQYFRLQLRTSAATRAREYLASRGFDDAALERWEIGYALDERQALFRHLSEKSVAPDLIIDAGLSAKPDDGGAPYDRFRGRIIFPIRDARGRAIALGGRSLDPNARAKYLNSPETELFDKGRSLFNHARAREQAGKGQTLVVGEGYMDVIALSEAGFGAVVAPLGTAITEDQLRLLWRIHPEPIVALDGDTAGLRAAMRVIDLALPMLEAGQSLRFAIMPEGLDPDDLIKSQGVGAMQKVLDQALPMVQLLWRRETEGKVFDSPERKAALDKVLREAIRKIADPSVRSHYGEEIKRMRQDLFAPARRPQTFSRGSGKWSGKVQPRQALPETRASVLASGADQVGDVLREAVILGVVLRNPHCLHAVESDLEALDFRGPDHKALAQAILSHDPDDADGLYDAVAEKIGTGALEKLFAQNHLSVVPSIHTPGDQELAQLCLAQELAKLKASRGAEREIEEAARDLDGQADEGLTWRLSQAAESRSKAERSETQDRATYDMADNGVRLNRSERDAWEKILQSIEYGKKK